MEGIVVQCIQPMDYMYVEISMINGLMLERISLDKTGKTVIKLPDEPGNYFIQLKGASKTTLFKIIKY